MFNQQHLGGKPVGTRKGHAPSKWMERAPCGCNAAMRFPSPLNVSQYFRGLS